MRRLKDSTEWIVTYEKEYWKQLLGGEKMRPPIFGVYIIRGSFNSKNLRHNKKPWSMSFLILTCARHVCNFIQRNRISLPTSGLKLRHHCGISAVVTAAVDFAVETQGWHRKTTVWVESGYSVICFSCNLKPQRRTLWYWETPFCKVLPVLVMSSKQIHKQTKKDFLIISFFYYRAPWRVLIKSIHGISGGL